MTTPIDPNLVTTALELPGHRIVRNLGVVRGIVVRSRSLFGTLGGTLSVAGDTSLAGNTSVTKTLQVGKPSTSYGTYLQVPMVSTMSAPPSSHHTRP